MDLRNKRIRKDNRDTTLLLIPIIAFLAKMVEHLLLPDNYFYDSSRILGMVLGDKNTQAWGGSYEVTSDLFRSINIFNFTTLLQWSILIGIIFDVLLVAAFIRIKGLDLLQSVFALMCVGLCNIYVFNLGKDIIQFVFFSMCFLIIIVEWIPNWLKALGCAAIFYWESTFFRNYYIIMGAFTLGIYIIIWFIRKKKVKLNFKKLVLILMVLYLMMYVFLNIARIAMPEEYNEILTSKDNVENLMGSTRIFDQIEFGENVNLYMLNYIINSIRMMFPVELLTGGVFYFPFLAFQVLLIYYMYKNIRMLHDISNTNIIALSVFIAFFMGSVLFEPDFGSFARHEAAAFPIIFLFALDNLSIIKNG